MPAWSEPRFVEQVRDVGAAYADAHAALLEALRAAGAVPTFDGKGIRSDTKEAPRLARNAAEFVAMDFDAVASAVRKVAAIAAGH